jgi:hypothetical protein
MIELEIPEAAFDAGAQAENSDDSISLAAPLIVAAELRRLAPQLGPMSRDIIYTRANELDPQAS